MSSISVVIPLSGSRDITQTVRSINRQTCKPNEIIIVRNNSYEYYNCCKPIDYTYITDIPIKVWNLRIAGKGIALNYAALHTHSEIIAVVDADCRLDSQAIELAVSHFTNSNVVAVGGRISTLSSYKENSSSSILETCQRIEYNKAFNITRPVFNLLNANILISGAFGLFRRSALLSAGGYDMKTVGEDMEIVLRLQSKPGYITNRIVYERDAVCYTCSVNKPKDLWYQRERWQRGLIDSLLIHKNLFRQKGRKWLVLILTYQMIFELLGPIVIAGSTLAELGILLGLIHAEPIIPTMLILIYYIFEYALTCISEYMDSKRLSTIKLINLAAITVIGFMYQIFICTARIYGIITFKKRRYVWR